jgi:4'-phosphopantetheinyl transferase
VVSSTPSEVAVGAHRVHVALAPIPAVPQWGMLTADERETATGLRGRRLAEFAASRSLLRQTAAKALRIPPFEIALVAKPGRAPMLAGDAEVGVSLSHCDAYTAAAVCRGAAVGIDVERLRMPRPETVRRWSTLPAYRGLDTLDPQNRARPFTEAWVVQEACVKVIGGGLAAMPWSIPVNGSVATGRWREVQWRRLTAGTADVVAAVAVSEPR